LAGVYSLAFELLFIFVMARDADTSNYYSKQYGLPCSKCHGKIPTLTEFGSSFKNNGYSFEKKVPSSKNSSGSSLQSSAEPLASVGAKVGDEKSKENSSLNIPQSQPSDARDYVYKGQSTDGTYAFSDNPMRVSDESSVESEMNAEGAAKKHRRSVTASKPVLSKAVPAKRRKNKVAKAPETREPVAEPVEVPQPVALPAPPPRNYEECMGKILITSGQPKSAAEAMEQFEKAERSCTPYAVLR